MAILLKNHAITVIAALVAAIHFKLVAERMVPLPPRPY